MKLFTAVLVFFCLCSGSLFPQQFSLMLSLDGPDPDDTYGPLELIRFGQLDHLGSSISGGDFSGVRARRLGSQHLFDEKFEGVLYEFTPNTGGNNPLNHKNATIALKIESPGSWQLSVSAQAHGDPSMRVDQLLYKEDRQREYTPFTAVSQTITQGGSGIHHLFYDFALKVEPDDLPGNYSWQIIYVIIEY